jgi:zona occludens toxin
MINLLLGPPGAGKSYEAVVFHVLPALLSSRKVITNLPLNIKSFSALGVDVSLIELRVSSIDNPRPFMSQDDYGSEWRGEGDIGPLYVIDECHKPLPKGMTIRYVEEWFAEHRHEGADVLLITQSYGKISQSIRDMVQVVYRVRKATALGSDKRYIRKVQDGIRGEVVNENVRAYNPARYSLYQSHTKSTGAVLESKASDIVPIWRHWSFIGAAICIPFGIILVLYYGSGVFFPTAPTVNPVVTPLAVVQPQRPAYVPHNLRNQPIDNPVAAVAESATPVKIEVIKHPFWGLGLHVRGSISSDVESVKRKIYLISASQNGQHVFDMNDHELTEAGYVFLGITSCLVSITFGEYQEYLTCNSPSQNINI